MTRLEINVLQEYGDGDDGQVMARCECEGFFFLSAEAV